MLYIGIVPSVVFFVAFFLHFIDFELTCLKLFQKCVVRIELDIYVFITVDISITKNFFSKWRLVLIWKLEFMVEMPCNLRWW